MGWYGVDSSGSGEGPVAGSCELGSEPSGSIKSGLFFWRNAPEWRSRTYLKEQNSKKAKIK
jgi:hypothetical protein